MLWARRRKCPHPKELALCPQFVPQLRRTWKIPGCTLGQVVGIKEVHDDVWLVSNAWRDRR